MVIATGADHSHAKSLVQLLESLARYEPETSVIVWDLGLTHDDIETIKSANKLARIERFKFDEYPRHFRMEVNAGEYAWKPAIINETLHSGSSAVCWMDAGNMLVSNLHWIRRVLNGNGFYSPDSTGLIRQWTHPSTIQYLHADKATVNQYNLNGACIAFANSPENKEFVERWLGCAMDKECIAPKGSSKANHRHDQSVLGILAHQSGLATHSPRIKLGFITHQDRD